MRYLIGLIISIVVIIFIIIKLLSGGGGDTTKPAVPRTLGDYADTSTIVRYTIDNPIQAAQNHNSIIIVVGNTSATLTITQGYDGQVVTSKSYPNTVNGYTNFLLALQRSGGYTLGNRDPKLADGRGYCATGNRYAYDIISGDGELLQHFWSTSCSAGTFKGRPATVRTLFRNQIPDFNTLTRDISF